MSFDIHGTKQTQRTTSIVGKWVFKRYCFGYLFLKISLTPPLHFPLHLQLYTWNVWWQLSACVDLEWKSVGPDPLGKFKLNTWKFTQCNDSENRPSTPSSRQKKNLSLGLPPPGIDWIRAWNASKWIGETRLHHNIEEETTYVNEELIIY